MRKIPIKYYEEVKQDTLVSEVLGNGELVRVANTIYKVVVI